MTSKVLVYVAGLGARPKAVKRIADDLAKELGDDWAVRTYVHGLTSWSVRDLDDVAWDLAATIRVWGNDAPVEEIVLAGHSIGGLIARAAFVRDSGTVDDDPGLRDRLEPWTSKVRRIVLIGSPNSGFRKEAMTIPMRLAYRLAVPWADFAVEQVEAGGYWLTNLRLRWMEAMRRIDHPPVVVQVLGTMDGLVGEEDMLDSAYLTGAVRIDIPGANHTTLVDPDHPFVLDLLRQAIAGAVEPPEPTRDRESGATYFILHGIRASSYDDWVSRLADQLAKTDPQASIVAPAYGYFSARSFALPLTRHRKVHEFLRWYGNYAISRDPNLFRFAGHSNGTYMMARSLLKVPAMRFERIYLAASVLPADFNWDRISERRQVGAYRPNSAGAAARSWLEGRVHNDRARIDVPVGVLCSLLRALGMRDIGTAGYDGFTSKPGNMIVDHSRALTGGHGAAFKTQVRRRDATATGAGEPETADQRFELIARFLKGGESTDNPVYAQSRPFRLLSRFVGQPVVAWLLLLAPPTSLGWYLVAATGWPMAVMIFAGILILIGLVLRAL